MASSSSNPGSGSGSGSGFGSYDELYGVGLLDDLHNYFPALLYEPDAFDDVQEVLHYVSSQARRRSDLYSYGQEAYFENLRQQRMTSAARGVGSLRAPRRHQIYSTNVEVSTQSPPAEEQSEEAEGTEEDQVPAEPPQHSVPRITTRVIDLEDNFPLTTNMMTALLAPSLVRPLDNRMRSLTNLANLASLLNLPQFRDYNLPSNFLEPVPIIPTATEIQTATETEGIVPQETDTCSICQDGFQPEQRMRKIKHCGHLFHQDCIGTWFQQNSTCPTCRYDIRERGQRTLPSTHTPLPSTSPDAEYH